MMDLPRNQLARARQGYSLVELLLTTSLLLLFSGLAVVSLNTLSQGSALTEGSIRFETMLRFARAEAAQSGRRVRVNFVQDSSSEDSSNQLTHVELTWEPNPVSEPEVFQDLQATQWGVQQVNEAVGVEIVRLVGTTQEQPHPATDEETSTDEGSAAEVTDALAEEETGLAPAPSITFNPNGSCDSAEITLAGRKAGDDHRMLVRLEGFTGSVSRSEPPAKDAATKPEPSEAERRACPAESR